MILNENINRIKQVMGLLNEELEDIIKKPPGDPYIYKYDWVYYYTYKCGKNKQCPNPIPWINVTKGMYEGKPGYAKFEAAIKYLIYQKEPTEYKIINNIRLTAQELNVDDLYLSYSDIKSLPEGLNVGGNVYLNNCPNLTSLPEGLEVGGSLALNNCPKLVALPEGLKVGHEIALYNCTSLTKLPKGLVAENCIYINKTPLLKFTDDQLKEMVKPGTLGKINRTLVIDF